MVPGATIAQARRLDALSGGLCCLAENILSARLGAQDAQQLLLQASLPFAEGQDALQALAGFCAEILCALQTAGALTVRDRAKACDFESLGAFCLGVLRWPPEQYLQAGVTEVALAAKGYYAWRGASAPPSARFLEEMTRLFPDTPQG